MDLAQKNEYWHHMHHHRIFIDRRRGRDRRRERDPCAQMPLDLYHRKRRKSKDRRAAGRSLEQDYYAYFSENTPYSNH